MCIRDRLDDAIETKQIFEKLLALMDEKGEPVESKPLVYKAKDVYKRQVQRILSLSQIQTLSV